MKWYRIRRKIFLFIFNYIIFIGTNWGIVSYSELTTGVDNSLKEQGYRSISSIIFAVIANLKRQTIPIKKRKMIPNMINIMKIVPFLGVLAIIIWLQSCSDSIDKSPFESEAFGNDIKDTTLAGSGIEILGGTIGKTSASVGFRFKRDKSVDYKIWIEWGVTDSVFEHKEILNRYPNDFVGGVKNVFHIDNLKTQTTYFILFTSQKGTDVWKVGTRFTTL